MKAPRSEKNQASLDMHKWMLMERRGMSEADAEIMVARIQDIVWMLGKDQTKGDLKGKRC